MKKRKCFERGKWEGTWNLKPYLKLKQVDLDNIHTLEKELPVEDIVIEGQQRKMNELEDRLVKFENTLGKQIITRKKFQLEII